MRQALGFCLFTTAIGECALAWDATTLVGVQLPEAAPDALRARMARRFPGVQEQEPTGLAQAALDRIRALLEGVPDDLADVPLALDMVPEFHQRVYAVARAIPPGEVLTYGDVARRIGDPGAARAVGQALGANPFAPVVPCHRVMAAGGRSGGFSAEGGAHTKLRMLEIEKARLGGAPGLFD
jgi:methylated-DNA-[protein]-cysteine S-methyltransferase